VAAEILDVFGACLGHAEAARLAPAHGFWGALADVGLEAPGRPAPLLPFWAASKVRASPLLCIACCSRRPYVTSSPVCRLTINGPSRTPSGGLFRPRTSTWPRRPTPSRSNSSGLLR
jgi:hypothetical protein